MKVNIGPGDRWFRIIGGIILIVVFGWLKSWWALVGVVLLITGILNFCPIYYILKMSTAKKQQS